MGHVEIESPLEKAKRLLANPEVLVSSVGWRELVGNLLEVIEKPSGAFTVGAYTVREGMESGKVWIGHESGEGGDFQAERVEAALGAFYKDNF